MVHLDGWLEKSEEGLCVWLPFSRPRCRLGRCGVAPAVWLWVQILLGTKYKRLQIAVIGGEAMPLKKRIVCGGGIIVVVVCVGMIDTTGFGWIS